jgi:hypothetical protein
MAKFVVTEPVIVFAGSTVTSSCASVTISVEADDVETTAFGGSGWRTRIGGLKSGSVDFEFHQDFAAGSIDSLFWPNLGGTVQVKVRPGGTAAIGTTNPEYQFDVLVAQYNPIDSAVGDLATVSVSLPITGVVTRATAA